MAFYFGDNVAVGLGDESAGSYSTAVARANWIQPATVRISDVWEKTSRRKLLTNAGGTRNVPQPVRNEVGVAMELDFCFDFMGPILQAITGVAVSTTGSGPYDHTYEPNPIGLSEPAKFYTMEVFAGDSGNMWLVRGAVVNQATFTISRNAFVGLSLDWIAARVNAPASKGSETYGAFNPVNVGAATTTLTWNSIDIHDSQFDSITFTVNNALERAYSVSGGFYTGLPYYGRNLRSVTMQINGLRYDDNVADAFNTAQRADPTTQSDATLTITDGANIVELLLRNAYVTDENVVPPMDSPADIRFSPTLMGTGDATDPDYRIKVTNASSSGIANA